MKKKRKEQPNPEEAWTPPLPFFDGHLDDDEEENYYYFLLEQLETEHQRRMHNRKQNGWYYPDEDDPIEGFHLVESDPLAGVPVADNDDDDDK